MHCAVSVLDRSEGTSIPTLPIAIKSPRRHPNKNKRRPITNDDHHPPGSVAIKSVVTPSSPFFKLPPSPSPLPSDATMDLFEQDFEFELPLYTPSQITLAASYQHGLVARSSKQRQRYAPYLVPQRAAHKMNLYYVDAAYIEDARGIYRPEAPEPVLDAILHPPQNGRVIMVVRGLFNRVLGILNNNLQSLRRTVFARD